MYPNTCYAGYPMPLRTGKFELMGYSAAPSAVGTAMEVAIIDDRNIGDKKWGSLITTMESTGTQNTKTVVAWDKIAAGYTVYASMFPEPLKVRHGISVYCSNVKAGSFCLYIR